ncbi:MAG: hypothetical protein HOV80_22815 [Polyangiaceae bacterium]|nr:hypothetical protein [Polyangiaceae bacterium]
MSTDNSQPPPPLTEVARQRFTDHRWLVRLLAQRAKARGVSAPEKELVSSGNLGLMETAVRHVGLNGDDFVKVAWARVAGAMLDHLRAEHRFSQVLGRLAQGAGESYLADIATSRGSSGETTELLRRDVAEDAMGYFAAWVLGAVTGIRALDPEQAYVARQEWHRVITDLGAAMSELPVRDYQVLHLRYYEGIELKDIAFKLSPPVQYATVTAYHRDALVRLGKRLRARGIKELPSHAKPDGE